MKNCSLSARACLEHQTPIAAEEFPRLRGRELRSGMQPKCGDNNSKNDRFDNYEFAWHARAE
jgi:hypothetical protein